MTTLRSPEDILTTELKQIFSAERQLTRALPRMMKKAQSEQLRGLLEQRVHQGEQLIEEVEDALDEMDAPKSRAKNIAAEGLIDDANHHLEEIEDERLCDPLLLASVQQIEHYCIATWGTVRSMGELLEKDDVVKCMERALADGKELDKQMTKLAEEEVNPQMMQGAEEGQAGEEEEEDEGGSGSSRRGRSSSGGKSRSKSH